MHTGSAQSSPGLVASHRGGMRRDVAKPQILTVARAAEQLQNQLAAKPKSQPWQRLTIFVSTAADAEVQGMSAQVAKAARTFDGFVKVFGKLVNQ